jgi:predicted N-acetyltransferase YhbS
MPSHEFRLSYSDDASLEDRVFALLETWFVGIDARRRAAARLGSTWEGCSTPFVHEIDGRLVSHVGLLDMPYVLNGQEVRVGGIHGVCTLESQRRKGHFRRIMEEALDFCESRFYTLELGTENPEYYEPFGFRVVPEHRFVARVRSSRGRPGFRPIDPARADDLELLDRFLLDRTPVSKRLGVVGERDVFKFSQGTKGLHHSETLDCLAVFEIENSRLSLYDVVSTQLPSIDELLAQISAVIDQIEFYFSPDRFDVEARPELHRYLDDHYMVRGPFAAESELFMVPPPARH